jgi:hypothetical protein
LCVRFTDTLLCARSFGISRERLDYTERKRNPRRKNNYGGDKDYNDPYVLTVASAVRGKATCWTHCFPSYVRSLLELSVIVKWKSVRKAKRPVRTIVANDWKKA